MFFGKIKRFLRDRIASIAPIFAIMAVPMIVVAGAATDIARHHNTNEHVQMALDSAGLAAARHVRLNMTTPATTLNAEIKAIAQDYFEAELKARDDLSMKDIEVQRAGAKLSLSVKGEMPTSFMRLTGRNTLEVNTKTEIMVGVPSSVEMALVLDMSHSMGQGGRLEALQASATDLIDALVDPDSEKVKIAIVPFGQHINVGTNQRDESWIRVESDRDVKVEECRRDERYLHEKCIWLTEPCLIDGNASRCPVRKCSQQVLDDAPRVCTEEIVRYRWHGCVLSRWANNDLHDGNYNRRIKGYVTQRAAYCARPITPLTNNRDELKLEVQRLQARGGTHMPSGLSWGIRTLSSIAPFDEGKPMSELHSEGGFKTIVLMSDGANSLIPDIAGRHQPVGTSSILQDTVDGRTQLACDRVKNAQIELYTIAFDVNDTDTERLLRNCASSTAHAFVAEDADELKEVFKTITDSVMRDIAVSA